MILMPDIRVHPGHKVGREKILAGAVDVAREALNDLTRPENVGEHAGFVVEAERILTHAFECLLPGYQGWYWTVTISRVPRSSKASVDEMALRPGNDALLAPEWIPWAQRVQPKDVTPTDRLPYKADDPLLEQGLEATGEDADQLENFELGLGRPRVLSQMGRTAAFERWYKGENGPNNQGTRQARASCSTCGYLMRMGGSARQLFGVCANEWSAYDGKVVSLDHGCGSHSETDAPSQAKMWDQSDPIINETNIDVLASSDEVSA